MQSPPSKDEARSRLFPLRAFSLNESEKAGVEEE